MKYADLFGLNDDHLSASSILEKLVLREEAPILVRQWLGYHLRFLPERADDAIAYSKQYLSFFPDDTDPLFNIAYAYASKYCRDSKYDDQRDARRKENLKLTLSTLKEALRDQPAMADRVRNKWTEPGGAFECLSHDPDFMKLVSPVKAGTTMTPIQ